MFPEFATLDSLLSHLESLPVPNLPEEAGKHLLGVCKSVVLVFGFEVFFLLLHCCVVNLIVCLVFFQLILTWFICICIFCYFGLFWFILLLFYLDGGCTTYAHARVIV